MPSKYLSLIFTLLLFPLISIAQSDDDEDISIRFKTGLNFSKLLGPSESINGQEVEDYSFRTGFHIAGGIDYSLSDRWGLRAMLSFMQKGTKYDFEGSSFLIFYSASSNLPVLSQGGNRKVLLSVNNSYLGIPISGYGRFGRVEIEAGATIGYLITSKAQGELIYSNPSANLDPVTVSLDYDYLNDSFSLPENPDPVTTRRINGQNAVVPTRIGAYYEALRNNEKKYNPIDLSLHAHFSFFLNRGLFIGLGVEYSLLDATNSKQDFSQVNIGADQQLQPITNDADHYLVLQSSIGFNF